MLAWIRIDDASTVGPLKYGNPTLVRISCWIARSCDLDKDQLASPLQGKVT